MYVNQGMPPIDPGYAAWYFNMNDPNMEKRNVPEKQDSSCHVACIVASAFLIGGIVALALLVDSSTGAAIGIMVGGYFIYLIASICCSEIKGYITNVKRFDEYNVMYNKMVSGRGYFIFHIECYHYETRRDSKGRTSRHRVTTHTATENSMPLESFDMSGKLEGIQDITKYVFINYLKKFFFINDAS